MIAIETLIVPEALYVEITIVKGSSHPLEVTRVIARMGFGGLLYLAKRRRYWIYWKGEVTGVLMQTVVPVSRLTIINIAL